MKLPVYLTLQAESELALADSFVRVAETHGDEPDIHYLCLALAKQCVSHAQKLSPLIGKYGAGPHDDEPERLEDRGLGAPRPGPLGMLRDLQDLHALAGYVHLTWIVIEQAAHSLRDTELLEVCSSCDEQTSVQQRWLQTRIKQSAPQVLIAAA
ncbi:hypothetical protein AAIB33_17920 [Microbacterium sp. AZCO]|uniref:hypothetical protein n=1 Tax=Microbacterium sp. AZCO TaxID=3142976 RepID=UPI0031F3BA9D